MHTTSIELLAALCVTGLAGMGLLEAIGFPGPSAYLPTAVLGLATLLGLIWTAQSLWAMRSDTTVLLIDRSELKRLAIIMGGSLTLAALLPLVGFFTGFAIMIPAIGWLLGYRNIRGLALGTALFLGPLYVLFAVVLKRPLPLEAWQQIPL